MTHVLDPFADPRVGTAPAVTAVPFPVERYRALGATDEELTVLQDAWDKMPARDQRNAAEYLHGAADEDLTGDLEAWRAALTPPEETPEGFDVAAATIPTVLAAVEDGRITREAALEAETARGEDARATLIAKLQS